MVDHWGLGLFLLLFSNLKFSIPVFPDVMIGMGFSREEIREALTTQKYNEITATYLLLSRRSEVRIL